MPPPRGTDDDCELEFDLERLINDTLTCGPSESPSLARAAPAIALQANPPVPAQPELDPAIANDMSVRINNYERLFACAEHLASVKKNRDELHREQAEEQMVSTTSPAWTERQQRISECEQSISRIYVQMAEELGISVGHIDGVHAEEHLLQLLQRFIPRDQLGNPLSIGSIPHFCGEACVGPCRFHRKGKCFDGALCRFCHCPGEHVGAVKKISKKSRKSKKSPKKDGMPGEVGSQNALAALFAALDVSNDTEARGEPYSGYAQTAGHYGQQEFVPLNWSNNWASHNAPIY